MGLLLAFRFEWRAGQRKVNGEQIVKATQSMTTDDKNRRACNVETLDPNYKVSFTIHTSRNELNKR